MDGNPPGTPNYFGAISDLAKDVGALGAQVEERVTYKELMAQNTDLRREILQKIDKTMSDMTRQIEASLRERDAKSVNSMLSDLEALRRDFRSTLEAETARATEKSRAERDKEQAELHRLLNQTRDELSDRVKRAEPRFLNVPVWVIQLILVLGLIIVSLVTRDPGLVVRAVGKM